jgi:cytoskeletal protein CcmA (bactofilin family)
VIGKRAKEDVPDELPTTDRRQVSVVGKGMKVLGDCECEGELRIDGTVTGNVRAPQVLVAETGSVDGDLLPIGATSKEGRFSVAGRVGGAVRGVEVEVRRGGSVVGPVVADRAVIHGHVGGGIIVSDRLALEGTAVVEGDIEARRLAVKEGAQFNGKIKMKGNEPTPRERPTAGVGAQPAPIAAS